MAMPRDFHKAMRPVRTSATGAVYLVERLENAAPAHMTEAVRLALLGARSSADAALEVMKLRQRAKPVSALPTERLFEALWGGVHQQVEAWADIPNEPRAVLARQVLASLFPGGLTFLTLSFEDEWVESRARLERIDEESFEPKLAELIHPAFLPKLRDVHTAFGDALGVGETPVEIPSGRALYEAIRDASFAIANYVRVLAGAVDADDPEDVERYVKAVAPIAAHRAQYHTNRTTTEPTEPTDVVDPEAPVEPVEPTDVVDPEAPVEPLEPVEPVEPVEPTPGTE